MMGKTYALFALRRLYAERLGRGGSRADLRHISAVIRMISPDEDVAAIKPVRPHVNRRGQNGPVWLRAAFDVLRTANGPMTAREIAVRVLEARGEPYDADTLQSVQCSLLSVLRRRLGNGVTRDDGSPRRWRLG